MLPEVDLRPQVPHFCAKCLVGGYEYVCWLCEGLMERGDVLRFTKGRTDQSMFNAHTRYDPHPAQMEYKMLDDLLPRGGESWS